MNFIFYLWCCTILCVPLTKASETKNTALYDIEGVVYPPDFIPHSRRQAWLAETKVYVRGGHHIGFLKENGSFTISKLKPGSYIVEVVSSNYVYEPVRVDINTKGKFRARKINYLQNTQISPLPYPLKLKAMAPARYFQVREQWRLVDLLFNPMVIMMVLPLACIMLLPHVINDPEAKKEVEQFPNFTKYDMPEVSEMITSFFSDGTDKQNSRTSKQKKGKQCSSVS